MKRFFLELLIFIFGFSIGFGELLYLYYNNIEYRLDSNIVEYIDSAVQKSENEFMKMLPWWTYALVIIIILLVVGIVFTGFLRIFANSKIIKRLTVINYIVITLIVAVPFARFLMMFIDIFLISTDFAIFASIRGVAFSILLRFQIYAFGFTYNKMLNKPVKNCRVLLCNAINETEFKVERVLAKNMTFDQCFNFIRNYTNEIERGQFFRIQEKGFMGIGNIAHWNYYRDGQPMDCSEDNFIMKMYNSSVTKSLKLRPEEGKNE